MEKNRPEKRRKPLLLQGTFTSERGGCGGMLGSPPAAQRPVTSRGHWPNPPPAHTNGVVEGRYGGGEGVPLGFPRIPHPAAPYPHKVEEICGGSYIETKARKSQQPPPCLCKTPSTVWERESLVVAGCSRTTPLSLRGKQSGLLPPSPHLAHSSAAALQGSTSGGIPVGIAVARQRVQSTPPPPLTVVACEERSQQISGWPFPPPPNHWHYPGGGVDGPAVGLQLARDPLSGQLLLLPTPSAIDSMQRAVVWPGCGGGLPPPLQVMQQPQPLLLDRLVTLATPAQEKRRPVDEPLTSVMVPCDFSKNSGSCGGQGLALIQSLGGGPPHFPSLLIHQMPHNNSLLLTAEQSLNTSVVISSNQLSEIGPQVIGALEPSSLVISHTETNHSFVRSDINTVFPLPHHPPHHPHEDPIVIKEELKQEIQEKHLQSDKATSPATDLSLPSDSNAQLSDEETKEGACVQDASNQTETPTASDDDSAVPEKIEVAVKSESDRQEEEEGRPREETPPERRNGVKEETEVRRVEEEQEEEEVQRHGEEEEDDTAVPDLSGLELLSNSIAEYEAHNKSFTVEEPEESEEESRAVDGSVMLGGRLDLLCELAHQRFIEESLNNATEVKETWNEVPVKDTVPVPERPKEKRPKESKAKGNGDNVEWKMSELKRLYSETQKTKLTKVPPKKGPGRPKKSSNVAAKKPRLSTPSPAPSEPPVLEPSWCTSPSHKSGILSPPTLTPHKRKSSDSPAQDSDSSGSGKPPPLSPACSSSKKRKVGRPKKRPEKPVQTETLVSKSLRCSKTIVDLLLANQAKQDVPKPNKIRPKLKAEAKIKSWCDEDELEWSPSKENGSVEPLSDSLHSERPWSFKPKEKLSVESPKRVKTKKREEKECEKRHPRKPVKVLAPKLKRDSTEKPVVPDNVQPVKSIPECTLTIDHLDGLPCRVLVAMGGLFYAGQLTEVTPPDLYGVTLDKERGHRPHILCREQILTDAILEIRCDNLLLPSGTRLCAYWSQQYRCLYPGTVCADSSPDDKFICVEFDDGDNGKINRDDIRLLPHDYPIVEYDPNPLLTLGKRKRHNSTNSCDSQVKTTEVGESQAQSEPERVVKPEPIEEKLEPVEEKPEPEPEPEPVAEPEPEATAEPEEEEPILAPKPEEARTKPEEQFPFIVSYDSEQERKRLKKKRREKLKQRLLESGDVRKHRHKHKESCSKESCKAKHKHKHKHRHRRHKHKHCKPLEPIGLVIENSNTESTETTTDPQEEDDLPPVIEPVEPVKAEVTKKVKDRKSRQGSVESKSKMAAFLPARQLWGWSGKGFKRGKGQGRRKTFYKAIQRGKETITVGDCAVFLSTGRPDRPYIGKIESMWECWGSNMLVRVSWFYHPEETIGCPDNLPYPGALFESPHNDENDVQTISHKCEVLPLSAYKEKLRECPQLLETVYDNNDTYYLAGYYDPTNITLRLEPGVGGK